MRQALKEAGYCMVQALRHPRTQIVLKNPGATTSPIPWWGSITVLVLGIVSWVVSARWGVTGLDEASRAMVYVPLTNLFNMTRGLKGG